VRRLLDELFGRKALRLEQLRPRELHGFVLHEIQRVSRSHGKGVVTALRSFLRFVLQRGAIQTNLASTLPGVAIWRLSHLPKSLPPEQVERLLACCDRISPTGTRDHAILLLLARLGLRGGEVVAMTLEDLDWERGEIVVRGKGQRLERLPLPMASAARFEATCSRMVSVAFRRATTMAMTTSLKSGRPKAGAHRQPACQTYDTK
jgi:site-specific recombinase XerC